MERGSEEDEKAGDEKAAARGGEGRSADGGTKAPGQGSQARRLGPKDRELISLLGVCRYLTVGQMVRLGHWATTAKAIQYRLRGLSGEGTRYKVGRSTLLCSASLASALSTVSRSSSGL
jgi:hypothetical protein